MAKHDEPGGRIWRSVELRRGHGGHQGDEGDSLVAGDLGQHLPAIPIVIDVLSLERLAVVLQRG
ncbi:hypothetical protein WMF18_10250 [Sorangium sp. So ce315]|uniref:hypothetical protein n=1 Tax=Sorangium sp. So ce315 TaxID=3133299 RepID=UPI003F619459